MQVFYFWINCYLELFLCVGLEYQPLSFTLEALSEEMSLPTDKSSFAAVKNAATFCKWQKVSFVIHTNNGCHGKFLNPIHVFTLQCICWFLLPLHVLNVQ